MRVSCFGLSPGGRAYNPNSALWLATAAALAYRSPAQIRHVVTRIWSAYLASLIEEVVCSSLSSCAKEWEGMEFFHHAETDTQGFGMYGSECIVVCFRGTESSRDWSINLKISEAQHIVLPSRSDTIASTPLTYAMVACYAGGPIPTVSRGPRTSGIQHGVIVRA